MNYYPFHLGDYSAHTAHLDPIEDIAYRRLLDLYYLREAPLPMTDDLARLIRMRGHEEVVGQILHEFFVEDEDSWRHPRCDEEIAKMQEKQQKARASARASVNARAAKAERTVSERSTDAERPLNEGSATNTNTNTNTKEEEAPRKRAATLRVVDKPEGVSDQVWADWLALRRQKRAPVTATVVQGAKAEAQKAGMNLDAFLRIWCTRGSQGLQADWIKPEERRQYQAEAQDWRATRSGIEGKGKSLGLGGWDEQAFQHGRGEGFQAYRARVEAAVKEQEEGPADKEGQARIAGLLGGLLARKAAA